MIIKTINKDNKTFRLNEKKGQYFITMTGYEGGMNGLFPCNNKKHGLTKIKELTR